MDNRFGGQWTREKLQSVRSYLIPYLQIMQRNEKAQYFRTVYFDGFAGSGSWEEKGLDGENLPLFANDELQDISGLKKGSAELALEIEPGFDEYILIEQDREKAEALTQAIETYRRKGKRAIVWSSDANEIIPRWCNETEWKATRCVMFLDPYGLQIDWATIKAISSTAGTDLWMLFPLGQGVNRMLTTKKTPPTAWAERLTKLFGTDEWEKRFYRTSSQSDMFGENAIEKSADFDAIKNFLVERLRTVFPHVASNPRTLYNSRKNPIFLLCFAASNPKGGNLALKIANHLLKG